MTQLSADKVCLRCKVKKSASAFGRQSDKIDGLKSHCRDCRSLYSKSHYRKNTKAHAEYCRLYREKNKEAIRRRGCDYYQANREKIIERSNKHYQDNKSAKNEYYKQRRAKNPLFSLRHNALVRINKGLKSVGVIKSQRSTQYLGCEWPELARHIERQFLPGMSWGNRSEWHIDHIRPLASAKNLDELIPLLHFTNLRPLWAGENMAKADKSVFLI